MDGVLFDFVKQLEKTTKMSVNDWMKLDRKKRWDPVIADKKFWSDGPWLSEGKKLFAFVKKYNPHILSAYVEHAFDPNCIPGKTKWAMKNTGIPRGRINLVMRSQKKTYASPGSILIDDYEKNTKEFNAAGGTGITFKTANQTIAELKKLGFK
tara:strand:+ start:119 stop:577 length:459 start_codon:yes stop_codon:yes gene_type:complete